LSNILIIDDDNGIRELLKSYLQKRGYAVEGAEDTIVAREMLEKEELSFDLIVCDVMMPGENGFDFVESYKAQGGELPVIFLTAMAEGKERIKGLENGAEDYLTKPFEPKELELRINKIIDRFSRNNSDIKRVFKFGEFEFNLKTRSLKKDNKKITLSSKESDLLYYFVNNIGVATDRHELAQKFNGISERSIDVQVTRLRQKIEKDSKNPEFIQTEWGKGYIFRI